MTWSLGGTPNRLIKRIANGKDPFDITPITCDWYGVLRNIPHDTIVGSVTAQVSRYDGNSPELSIASPVFVSDSGTQTTIWVAQGAPGAEYMISLRAMTANSARYERSFIIPVVQR